MRLKQIAVVGTVFIVLTIFTGCFNSNTPDSSASTRGAPTVLAERLRVPWVIAFDGDTIYISERGGNIVIKLKMTY